MFNRPLPAPPRGLELKSNGTVPPPEATAALPMKTAMPAPATNAPPPVTTAPVAKTAPSERLETGHLSIIGNDLAIMGERIVIITKGALQVDGEVQADLHCAEVIIGEAGKVTGTIWADAVEVRGQVYGTIKGLRVTLMGKSVVEGDIHHHSLAVVEGASFDGRVRRPQDVADLKPILDPSQHAGNPTPVAP